MWVSQRKQHLGFPWEKDAVRHPALGSEVSAASSTEWSRYGSIYVQQVINNIFVTKALSSPLASRMEQGLSLQSNTADTSGKKDSLLRVKCCSSASPKQSRNVHAVTEKLEIKGKNYVFFIFSPTLPFIIQSTAPLLKLAQNLPGCCQTINTNESISLSNGTTRAWHEKEM